MICASWYIIQILTSCAIAPCKCQWCYSACYVQCDRACCSATSGRSYYWCTHQCIVCLSNCDILVKGTSASISYCNMICASWYIIQILTSCAIAPCKCQRRYSACYVQCDRARCSATSCRSYCWCNCKCIVRLSNCDILVKGTSASISYCNMICASWYIIQILSSCSIAPRKCQWCYSTRYVQCDRSCCSATSGRSYCRCNCKCICCLADYHILVKGTSASISYCNMICASWYIIQIPSSCSIAPRKCQW